MDSKGSNGVISATPDFSILRGWAQSGPRSRPVVDHARRLALQGPKESRVRMMPMNTHQLSRVACRQSAIRPWFVWAADARTLACNATAQLSS